MLIIHDDELARQLQAIADRENRPVEALLRSLLDYYPNATGDPGNPDSLPGTSLWLAAHLDELAFDTENPINPEEADDILNAEFADYLLNRMHDGNTSSSNG